MGSTDDCLDLDDLESGNTPLRCILTFFCTLCVSSKCLVTRFRRFPWLCGFPYLVPQEVSGISSPRFEVSRFSPIFAGFCQVSVVAWVEKLPETKMQCIITDGRLRPASDGAGPAQTFRDFLMDTCTVCCVIRIIPTKSKMPNK